MGSNNGALSLMTFNVLAETYCDGSFDYCPLAARKWSYRLASIIAEVTAAAPSVLALQEVEPRAFTRDFVPALPNYIGHYCCKPDSVVGVAIFVRSDAADIISVHRFCVRDLASDPDIGGLLRGTPPPVPPIPRTPAGASSSHPPPQTSPNEIDEWGSVVAPSSVRRGKVQKCSLQRERSFIDGTTWTRQDVSSHNRLWSWLDTNTHVAIVVVIQPRKQTATPDGDHNISAQLSRMMLSNGAHATATGSSTTPVVVMCTHIYWNPQYPEIKVLQAALFVYALDRVRRKVDDEGFLVGRRPCAVLFAGDFNVTPHISATSEYEKLPLGAPQYYNGVYELLCSGKLPASHPHHPTSRRKLHPESVPPLEVPLRWASAYAVVLGREPLWTNWHTHDFKEPLDYIFMATHERSCSCGNLIGLRDCTACRSTVTPATLKALLCPHFIALNSIPHPVAVLDVPDDDVVLLYDGAADGGCPNAGLPSDHVSLHVKLCIDTIAPNEM